MKFNKQILFAISACICLGQVSISIAVAQQATASQRPLYFIENRGQYDEQIKYRVQGVSGTVSLTQSEIIFSFLKKVEAPATTADSVSTNSPTSSQLIFSCKFKDANQKAKLIVSKKLPGRVNYYVGPQENWLENVPVAEELVYKDLYDGVDLQVGLLNGSPNFKFLVDKTANPSKMGFSYAGIDKLTLGDENSLIVSTAFGEFHEPLPAIYYKTEGALIPITADFSIKDDFTLEMNIKNKKEIE